MKPCIYENLRDLTPLISPFNASVDVTDALNALASKRIISTLIVRKAGTHGGLPGVEKRLIVKPLDDRGGSLCQFR